MVYGFLASRKVASRYLADTVALFTMMSIVLFLVLTTILKSVLYSAEYIDVNFML